jgi:hypothetical protein
MGKNIKGFAKPLGLLALLTLAYVLFVQYTANLNTKHLQQVPQFSAAGAEYGATHDQQACLTETFRQSTGCGNFSCGVYYGKFFKACVELAQPSVQLCEGVPGFTEEKDRASKDWLRDVCFDRPEANSCRLLMRQVQWQCQQQKDQKL